MNRIARSHQLERPPARPWIEPSRRVPAARSHDESRVFTLPLIPPSHRHRLLRDMQRSHRRRAPLPVIQKVSGRNPRSREVSVGTVISQKPTDGPDRGSAFRDRLEMRLHTLPQRRKRAYACDCVRVDYPFR